MKQFMDEDFLLTNETAKTLYHHYAEPMPVLDYHCHIDPREIAENRKFGNMTQVWLGGDHYKWRLMRANGVPESGVTGAESSDREKFQNFANVLPKCVGNPMYAWTHLELKRYFHYNGILGPDTAEEVWNLCNEKLKTNALSARGILEQSNVKLICTTDDPVDSLRWHKAIQRDKACRVRVLPAWRPDKILGIGKPSFVPYLETLSQASGVAIHRMQDVYEALEKRLDFFGEMGCRASDHGLDDVTYTPASEATLDAVFTAAAEGRVLSREETSQYQSALLLFLGREYARRGWVMQIHYGALRNVNSAMFRKLGPDTGFDCLSSRDCAAGLARFLDALNKTGELPKTVLYSLNPSDNTMLDSIINSFQGTEAVGKIQHGAAWWFNDTKPGMEAQLVSLASTAVLGNFIGMLTDSRSFLSYTRHEYFRRVLCNLLGTWVENGEYPNDIRSLGKLVQDISFCNANRFFGFGL